MAEWKCFVCGNKNGGKEDHCLYCQTIRIPDVGEKDGRIFNDLRIEISKIKAEVEQIQVSSINKWEYLEVSSEQIGNYGGLNNLGAQGWELVAATSYSEGGGMVINGIGGSNYVIKIFYVLKRPITKIPDDIKGKIQDVLNRTPRHLVSAIRKIEQLNNI